MFSFLSIFKINLCFCSPSFSIWISCSKENEWTVPLGLEINNGLNKTKGSIAPLLQIGLHVYKYVIIAGDKQMFSFIWKTMFKKWMFIFYLYCSFWVIVVKMHVFISNCPPCGRMTSGHLQDCTPACSSETRFDAHYKCSVCQRGSAGGTLANLISAGTWKQSHLLMQVTA